MPSDALVASIRESFGRVVYTHKTHEKTIDILNRRSALLRWVQVVLIALAAGGAISVLLGTGFWFRLATAVLASVATVVTIYQMSFDPDRALHEHRKCAQQLWYIREQYINLLADLGDRVVDDAEARRRRDLLAVELKEIYHDAPVTSPQAYAAAQAALKVSEEMTFTDEEIDRFLPKPLKCHK